MKQFISKISEDTSVTLGILIICLGGAAWLTEQHVETVSNAQGISQLQVKADENTKQFEEIRLRLTRIEDMMKKDLGNE